MVWGGEEEKGKLPEDRRYLMSEGERRKINRGEKTFRKRRKILGKREYFAFGGDEELRKSSASEKYRVRCGKTEKKKEENELRRRMIGQWRRVVAVKLQPRGSHIKPEKMNWENQRKKISRWTDTPTDILMIVDSEFAISQLI